MKWTYFLTDLEEEKQKNRYKIEKSAEKNVIIEVKLLLAIKTKPKIR